MKRHSIAIGSVPVDYPAAVELESVLLGHAFLQCLLIYGPEGELTAHHVGHTSTDKVLSPGL